MQMVEENIEGRVTGLNIRMLEYDDARIISGAFSAIGWNKSIEQYERYFKEQTEGRRVVFIALLDSQFAGYVTVEWASQYPPFAERDIPEIVDLNVLPEFRRRGIGNALLGSAEAKISTRSDIAGIGVGMTPDYGQAQRLYTQRGYVPDGRGLTQNREPVRPNQPIVVDDSTALGFTKKLQRD